MSLETSWCESSAVTDLVTDAPGILPMWVVTYNSKDFPNLYVVRIHKLGPGYSHPTEQFHTADSLEEIRKMIPECRDDHGVWGPRARFDRDDIDDPVIVESWI